ncbi:hypothetical protein IC611_12745 [Proteus mirabilis]
MLKEASNDAGVVFDRIRLTIAFERFKDHFNDVTPQLNEFIEFCKNQKEPFKGSQIDDEPHVFSMWPHPLK